MFKTIAFDIDGVLTNDELFLSKFLEQYLLKERKHYPKKINPRGYWYGNRLPEESEESLQKFTDWFLRQKDNWRTYAAPLTNALHNLGCRVIIITARGSEEAKEAKGEVSTQAFTEKILADAGIYYDSLHMGYGDKLQTIKALGVDLMVEDSPNQSKEIAKYIPVVFIDAPYNKATSGKNIWRISADEMKPDLFIDKIKYIENEMEGGFEDEMELTATTNFVIKPDMIIANPKAKDENIYFVISAREHPVDDKRLVEYLEKTSREKFSSVTTFHLSMLQQSERKHWEDCPEVMRRALKKDIPTNLDLSDTRNTNVYLVKTKVIKDLLKYAKDHPKERFIFNGIESFMLSRKDLEPYETYTVFFTDCGEREATVCKRRQHVKGYNAFLFLEDLTEVSTQLRKYRIIAGTAPAQLKKYKNRQWCDSEGVDQVTLLEGEKPYQPDLLENILDEKTWVVGDLHLSSKDPKKTKEIIKNIAAKVGRKDHLLILGDLDGKKGTGSIALTRNTLEKLPTKNLYLILGNNDPYTIEDYVAMGFKSVVDQAVFKRSSADSVVLTHCPVKVADHEINVHGHIHGSKTYWNVDWHNHFDVWDQDYYPIQIGECIRRVEAGEYDAVSEIHKRY